MTKNTEAHGTTDLANAYLEHLYSPAGQRLAAKHFYRPIHPEQADQADTERFQQIKLFTIEEVFGSWKEAQAKHFDDGGVFDRIFVPRN